MVVSHLYVGSTPQLSFHDFLAYLSICTIENNIQIFIAIHVRKLLFTNIGACRLLIYPYNLSIEELNNLIASMFYYSFDL